MKQITIYRSKTGKFISKAQYEKNQKKLQNENWTCLVITAKVFIVIVIIAAIISIL